MNKIPEELVEHIISFACDKRGYNSIEYHKRKKDNESKMKRIIVELRELYFYRKEEESYFKSLRPIKIQMRRYKIFKEKLKEGKPVILYHTGLYLNFEEEQMVENYYIRNS